jgi:hypothetical protein
MNLEQKDKRNTHTQKPYKDTLQLICKDSENIKSKQKTKRYKQ